MPGVLCPGLVSAQGRQGHSGGSPQKGHKDGEGTAQFSYEERLRELGQCSLNHLRGISSIHLNTHRDFAAGTEPD